ncbi:MAG: hypothetical protein UC708_07610 [Anaerovoracaceae bacterium]|nr:hypothetical protein [Anaerovoracaceae bacterium]
MKTYCRNGMMKNIPYIVDNSEDFMIQELENASSNKYIYPGDSINYALEGECVCLYDTFRNIVFDNQDEYYREVYSLPIWVQDAGQNSDCSISAYTFEQWIRESKVPNLYKHLYLVDCQFLVGTVQNLLCALEDTFIRYYKVIASFEDDDRYSGDLIDADGTIMLLSETAIRAASMIETYFTKAYSILDIICKICYEIQFIQEDFDSYKKIKSADILWGARKKLTINNTENTIFEKCELISTIEAIRNEIVHNGTWELNPKIFIRFENEQVQERFMLFPDFTQGHLATVKSRKHFFSSGIKVNDILYQIHSEFKRRVLTTLALINGRSI